MKILLTLLAVIALASCGGGGGGGGVPPAQAAPTAVVKDVTIGFVQAVDTDGVQVVACPANATAISSSCYCGIGAGAIFGHEVVGNGGICGCTGAGEVRVTAACSSLVFTTVAGAVQLQEAADATLEAERARQRQNKEAEYNRALGR